MQLQTCVSVFLHINSQNNANLRLLFNLLSFFEKLNPLKIPLSLSKLASLIDFYLSAHVV